MKISLKSRIAAVIAFLCLIALVLGTIGLYGISASNDSLKTVYEDRTVALEQISRIHQALLSIRITLDEVLDDKAQESLQLAADGIDANVSEMRSTWSAYMATYLTPEEIELARVCASQQEQLLAEGLVPAARALRQGDRDVARRTTTFVRTLFPATEGGLKALRDLQVRVAKQEFVAAEARYASLRAIVIAALVATAAIAWTSGFLLIRNIYRQLGGEPEYTLEVVRAIASGNLGLTIHTRPGDTGSLLAAMQSMSQKLSEMVGDIRRSTSDVTSASAQIAAGNLELSSRTEEQSSSLEQTAASMEELASTVQQNVLNASSADQLAAQAAAVAGEGGEVVTQMMETMAAIETSSRRIVDITGVIDSIAFQTNILALNAAVEAARAGAQGLGFAVVASEVRVLAQRSAGAAKEIKTLIEHSVQQVGIGSRKAADAGRTMTAIMDSVGKVKQRVSEISVASAEQGLGISQVNHAVTQLDQITQQNAALVEEAAASAASLRHQAEGLLQTVGAFRL